MDITTVNDRHLYEARVVVRDPEHPSRRLQLRATVVRFGPPGWLTVLADDGIDLYPTGEVLAVNGLREVGTEAGDPGASGGTSVLP